VKVWYENVTKYGRSHITQLMQVGKCKEKVDRQFQDQAEIWGTAARIHHPNI